ncbi:hypothetical protein [Duganella radicis]|uniref:Transposase n=1 Tax=Duganella radicis TaxID=551988 RepID=A0A6L6PKE0_9BURK|nr:hypothetical protein [Duganella radicis]MTV39576.1 hypothetical protein [Duganella radicis]
MTKYTNEKKEHALSQMSAPHKRDLRRKEKALAETAALLVSSRKYEALWTDGEDA